jgi:hypothetical protein
LIDGIIGAAFDQHALAPAQIDLAGFKRLAPGVTVAVGKPQNLTLS